MRVPLTELKALAFMHKKPFLHKDISELFGAPPRPFPDLVRRTWSPKTSCWWIRPLAQISCYCNSKLPTYFDFFCGFAGPWTNPAFQSNTRAGDEKQCVIYGNLLHGSLFLSWDRVFSFDLFAHINLCAMTKLFAFRANSYSLQYIFTAANNVLGISRVSGCKIRRVQRFQGFQISRVPSFKGCSIACIQFQQLQGSKIPRFRRFRDLCVQASNSFH